MWEYKRVDFSTREIYNACGEIIMERTILHVDMNSCYASIECLHNPAIRNKPVAVGGDVEQRHGIILAKNEIAKKFNIKTGEALWQAKEKCPDLVIVPPHYDRYLRFSGMARNIYNQYTDKVEAFGLDENWLDLTGSISYLKKDGFTLAEEIRHRIKKELGITVSIGVSWNKIFAKLGSDYRKPDATTVFSRDNYKDMVWPLPASDLLGVGRATTAKLAQRRIIRIGDIANTPPEQLQRWLGKWGLYLHTFANGMDTSPVTTLGYQSAIKSVGNSTTTPRDLITNEDVRITYTVLSESVAARLRLHSLLANTVQISLRDKHLVWFTRQIKLKYSSCIATEIFKAAMHLFHSNYNLSRMPPLRSIGVRCANLIDAHSPVQLDLFESHAYRDKEENIERAVDGIRRRFGHHVILRGNLLQDKQLGSLNPVEDHTIHPVGYF